MKFELESSDIEAIANMVASKLAPRLDAINKISVRDTSAGLVQLVRKNEHSKPESKVVGTKELMQITGFSRSTLWRLEREECLLARCNLSGRKVGCEVP